MDEQKEQLGADAAAVETAGSSASDQLSHAAPKKHALLCASRWVFPDDFKRNGELKKNRKRFACDCDGRKTRSHFVTFHMKG